MLRTLRREKGDRTMNILITGSTGFVGQRLLKQLDDSGISRKNIYLLTGKAVVGYSCFLHENYQYDRSIFDNTFFDVVIHLGAVTPKGKNEQGMMDYIDNVRTTMYLINHLPNIPKVLIYGSTVSVYESGHEIISEATPLTTEDDYGLSKIICERVLEEWAEKKGVCLQILRFGPIYGPGEETYNKLSGTFLKKCMANEPIHIYSDGTEYRSMIYVDDVCRMIMKAMELEEYTGPINIVEDQKISIRGVAELAQKVSDSKAKIIFDYKGSLRSDCYASERMKSILGETSTNYEQGMRELYKHLVEKENRC